eukprot:scaffold8717_cov167-Amphora_coffeaeformis.AAC.10
MWHAGAGEPGISQNCGVKCKITTMWQMSPHPDLSHLIPAATERGAKDCLRDAMVRRMKVVEQSCSTLVFGILACRIE